MSILEGNTFVVSDPRGDLEATPTEIHGLFLNDTRFLSRWILTVNGIRPRVLSTDDLAYYKVQFFAALTTGTVYLDSHLSVIRQREVDGGFHEELTLVSHDKEALDLEVRIEADADFADLFEVKDRLQKKGQRCTLAASMLEAAELFHERLPEAFAGYPRHDTHYPVEYPTACLPQAWATGAPLLLVRALLGLDSDGRHLLIDPALPPSIERLELLDIPGVWGRMDALGRARRSD